jgi:hypothetical protein
VSRNTTIIYSNRYRNNENIHLLVQAITAIARWGISAGKGREGRDDAQVAQRGVDAVDMLIVVT